jgi:DMSO/TMAO reductase YedYZ molybdopterin-dependent catalytic subunit
MHHCIQGWTNVAEWGGVPLQRVLDRCKPKPEARYVVFYAFDDKTITENEGRFGLSTAPSPSSWPATRRLSSRSR